MNITITGFIEKIRQMGYISQPLEAKYTRADNRVWTVLISPGEQNILVTFYKNRNDLGDYGFDVISEKQKLFGITHNNVYDTIDQIMIGGK